MYVVITRRAFQNVEDLNLQRIGFAADAEAAIRYAKSSEAGWTMYGAYKATRTEVAPTGDTLLRIVIEPTDKNADCRHWIEVRCDLRTRPATFDI